MSVWLIESDETINRLIEPPGLGMTGFIGPHLTASHGLRRVQTSGGQFCEGRVVLVVRHCDIVRVIVEERCQSVNLGTKGQLT